MNVNTIHVTTTATIQQAPSTALVTRAMQSNQINSAAKVYNTKEFPYKGHSKSALSSDSESVSTGRTTPGIEQNNKNKESVDYGEQCVLFYV